MQKITMSALGVNQVHRQEHIEIKSNHVWYIILEVKRLKEA
jgi:hypothetical protein